MINKNLVLFYNLMKIIIKNIKIIDIKLILIIFIYCLIKYIKNIELIHIIIFIFLLNYSF